MKNIIIKIYPHSIIDVITNSSTEIFCQIQSDDFLNEIKKELEKVLNRKIELYPLYYVDDEGNEHEDKNCIQFEMERSYDSEQLQDDFIKLIDNFLKNIIGENNYKISKGEY